MVQFPNIIQIKFITVKDYLKMLKRLSAAAIISTATLNATDTTLNDFTTSYHKVQSEINLNIKNTKYIFNPTEEEVKQLILLGDKALESTQRLKEYNKVVLEKNFSKWAIEESETISTVINHIAKDALNFHRLASQVVKHIKNYPSIAKTNKEMSVLWKEIYDNTMQYKQRAEDAKIASDFILKFIPKNKEVLEALA